MLAYLLLKVCGTAKQMSNSNGNLYVFLTVVRHSASLLPLTFQMSFSFQFRQWQLPTSFQNVNTVHLKRVVVDILCDLSEKE